MLGAPRRRAKVVKADPHSDFATVRNLQRKAQGKVRRSMEDATNRALQGTDFSAVQRAYDADNIDRAVRAVDIDAFERGALGVAEASRDTFLAGGTEALRAVAATISITDTPLTAAAEKWLEKEALDTVKKQLTKETLKAVRASLKLSFEQGLTSKSAADSLRRSIGLNSVQTKRLDKLRRSMQAQDLKASVINRRLKNLRDKMLKQRAELVARTELHTAVSAGRQEAWEIAADEGAIDPKKATKIWMTAGDARVDCCICLNMNGQRRGLKKPFKTDDGREIKYPGAPAHPRCRCTVRLTIKR